MKKSQLSFWIVAIAALFFLPFLGGVHLFDWDEINFAEGSREMLVLGQYLRVHIDFEPFWEKPPFFFWLQAMSMKLFGVGEYAARFPNAICGMVTLLLVFHLGTKLHNVKFGLLWTLAWFGSILPHFYFKSGIIDPWFNLWIFLGIYFFILGYWKKKEMPNFPLSKSKVFYLLLAGGCIGMGVLTKGPVAYIIAGLTLFGYWVYSRFRFYVNVWDFLWFTAGVVAITFVWLGTETILNGPWFLVEFVTYQYRLFITPDAGHGGFLGYHVVVLLVGCFPASLFAIRAFFKQSGDEMPHQKDFRIWMIILFWVVLILFSIVQSKIIHYSSMAYFPITYLAAWTLFQIWKKDIAFPKWMRISILTLGTILGLAVAAVPYIGQHIEVLEPILQKDPFALANLQATVNWSGWESIAGICILFVTWVGVWIMSKKDSFKGMGILFGGMAVSMLLVLTLFIGNVEKYTQGAAIRFFESLQGKDVYVEVIGYKSYAHLFYTQKQPVSGSIAVDDTQIESIGFWERLQNFKNPQPQTKAISKDWLLRGEIDKDVYFVTKINKVNMLEGIPGIEKVGEENGFVFFRRKMTTK